jgi:hypothetical protein
MVAPPFSLWATRMPFARRSLVRDYIY